VGAVDLNSELVKILNGESLPLIDLGSLKLNFKVGKTLN
jgi:hypothetical protein